MTIYCDFPHIAYISILLYIIVWSLFPKKLVWVIRYVENIQNGGQMSAHKNHTGILITGPAGNGKSTLMKLMTQLMNPPRSDRKLVSNIDMSRILFTWGVNQGGNIGVISRAASREMTRGEYVLDNTVLTVFGAWHEEVKSYIDPDSLLFIGGAPRTFEQLAITKHFAKSAIVHIRASYEFSQAGITERANGSDRPDDHGGTAIIDNRWRQYLEKTKPAVESLNGKCIHLCRESTRLHRRLEILAQELAERGLADARLTNHALNKLNSPNDPIHGEIAKIEGGTTKTKNELALV